MKTGSKRRPRLLNIAAVVAGVRLMTGCIQVTEIKVRGFMDEIVGPEVVPDSTPETVELLAQTQTPRDSLDLVLMSKWAINYLAGSVTVEKNFASSYGN